METTASATRLRVRSVPLCRSFHSHKIIPLSFRLSVMAWLLQLFTRVLSHQHFFNNSQNSDRRPLRHSIRYTAIMQTETPIWPVAIRFSHFPFLTEMLNHRKLYCKGIFRNAQIFIMKHSKLVMDMERHMAIVIRKPKANRETACNLASPIPQNDYLESFSIPIQ